MKLPKYLIVAAIIVAVIAAIFLVARNKKGKSPTVTTEEKVELPINTIPVEERPFITLTPDVSGHNLDLSVSGAPKEGIMEYEILYNAGDEQQGGLGSLTLTATQPLTKTILLGTRSAGGATTYHEGVTGGSLDITYGETRLKEQFNFLRYAVATTASDFTSVDGKFTLTVNPKGLKKDAVIVIMKSFGLPAPVTGKLVSGPYIFTTAEPIKGTYSASLAIPAEVTTPQVYGFSKGAWKKLTTRAAGSVLSFDPTGSSVFVLTSD